MQVGYTLNLMGPSSIFSFSDSFGCAGNDGDGLSYACRNFLSRLPMGGYVRSGRGLRVTTKALSMSKEDGLMVGSSSRSSKGNLGGDWGVAMMLSNFLDSYFLNI